MFIFCGVCGRIVYRIFGKFVIMLINNRLNIEWRGFWGCYCIVSIFFFSNVIFRVLE